MSLALAAAAAQAQAQSADEPKTLPKVSVAGRRAKSHSEGRSRVLAEIHAGTCSTRRRPSRSSARKCSSSRAPRRCRRRCAIRPGVTFLLGENGNTATGDSIFMRGFDTQGSIFIDGIRDLGSVTRDTFNTEQVEIAKGPAGPDYGRSAASGYVNLASKVPDRRELLLRQRELRHELERPHHRRRESPHSKARGTALRLNVMGQDGDVDGRDFIERKGWAFAPSLAFGLEGDTRAYFYLLHTEQDNMPGRRRADHRPRRFLQPGFRYRAVRQCRRGRRTRVDRDNWYGFASDFEEVKGTMFTARFEHDFNDNVTIRNTSRYGKLRAVLRAHRRQRGDASTDPDPDLWTVARTRQSRSSRKTRCSPTRPTSPRTSTLGVDAARHHGRLRVHQRRAVQPDVRAASARRSRPPISTTRIATTCSRATRRCATACTRAARRRPSAPTCSTRVTLRRQVAGDRRIPRRHIRHRFRQRVAVDRWRTNPRCPWARSCPSRCRSTTRCSRTRSAWCSSRPRTAASIYRMPSPQQPPGGANFTLSYRGQQRQQPEPRSAEGHEPRARHEVGIPRRRACRSPARSTTARTRTNWRRIRPIPTLFIQVGEREVKGVELGIVGKLTDNWEISGRHREDGYRNQAAASPTRTDCRSPGRPSSRSRAGPPTTRPSASRSAAACATSTA